MEQLGSVGLQGNCRAIVASNRVYIVRSSPLGSRSKLKQFNQSYNYQQVMTSGIQLLLLPSYYNNSLSDSRLRTTYYLPYFLIRKSNFKAFHKIEHNHILKSYAYPYQITLSIKIALHTPTNRFTCKYGSCPLLGPSNYAEWNLSIQMLLQGAYALGLVNGTEAAPMSGANAL